MLTGALSPWGAAVASVVLPVAGWAVAAQHPKIRSLVARHAR